MLGRTGNQIRCLAPVSAWLLTGCVGNRNHFVGMSAKLGELDGMDLQETRVGRSCGVSKIGGKCLH